MAKLTKDEAARFDVHHLTTTQIEQLEEAMNCDDLEQMVAVVDRIVAQQLKQLRRDTRQSANVNLERIDDHTWEATLTKGRTV